MPEAGEGFDFTSCLECGARACRGKKPVNTNRNYGDHVYTIDTFSRFNTIRCSLRVIGTALDLFTIQTPPQIAVQLIHA
jgi:hypothetical protein